MSIPAFIFDVGNVLVRWDPHALYAPFFNGDRAAIDAFLKEIDFQNWNIQQDKGRLFADGVIDLSTRFPQHAHLIRAYDTHWEECIPGPIAGMGEIINQLKHEGYPLYALTNFSREKFPIMRKRFEFFELFDDIIVSGEIGMVKPDPAIYHYTLQRIGRVAAECVFIDDALPNIHTARALGFETIHFTGPKSLEDELIRLQLL